VSVFVVVFKMNGGVGTNIKNKTESKQKSKFYFKVKRFKVKRFKVKRFKVKRFKVKRFKHIYFKVKTLCQ
jgi:hypothetical protein